MPRMKVLIVDDERAECEPIGLLLESEYDTRLAYSGKNALDQFARERPDVVILDMKMPGMDGIDVLRHIKREDPAVEVILLTGYASVDTVRKALALGAFDYIIKPPVLHDLLECVSRAVARRCANLQSAALLANMQHEYQTLSQEVEQARLRMITQGHETVYALLMSLQLRDAYSGHHSMAVMWLADQFARRLKLSAQERAHLRCAALVHDLGKIALPEQILNKPDPLSPADLQALHTHPLLSAEIISNVESLVPLVPIVRAHHEKWDGAGYPRKLYGDAIPWQSQILAICDTIHAMSSDRCYRARQSEPVIRHELEMQRGLQFNPVYVDAMLPTTLIDEIVQAESSGAHILTDQQIRQVLDGDELVTCGK